MQLIELGETQEEKYLRYVNWVLSVVEDALTPTWEEDE